MSFVWLELDCKLSEIVATWQLLVGRLLVSRFSLLVFSFQHSVAADSRLPLAISLHLVICILRIRDVVR